MSRAYRIEVQESLRRLIRGRDHVSTQLELLQVLPADQMAALLAEELAALGFEKDGDTFVLEKDGVIVSINPQTGEVRAATEVSQDLSLEKTGSGTYDEDFKSRRAAMGELREKTRQQLEDLAAEKEQALTQQATEKLESALRDLQQDLDGVVNRVTAEALKRKAAQLGEIKQITEDTENGSMTIVLEV